MLNLVQQVQIIRLCLDQNLQYHSATFFLLLFRRLSQIRPPFFRYLHVLEVELLLELLGQLRENLLDVLALLGRALHVGELLLRTELVDLILGNLPLITDIRLIADEEEDGVLLRVGLHLVHPKLADIFEAEQVREIEHQQDALTASVVGAGDGTEPLLPGSIPDLELYILAVNLDCLEAEVNPDGGQVVL